MIKHGIEKMTEHPRLFHQTYDKRIWQNAKHFHNKKNYKPRNPDKGYLWEQSANSVL